MQFVRVLMLTTALFTTGALSSPRADVPPARFAVMLYQSYVRDIMARSPGINQKAWAAWHKKWLTPHFNTQLGQIAEATGVDPVIKAQDYCNAWTTSTAARVITSDASSAVVSVTLGDKTPGWHTVMATLKKIRGRWLLDAVGNEGSGRGGCS